MIDPRDLRTAEGTEYTTLRDRFDSYLEEAITPGEPLPQMVLDLLEHFFYGGASTMGILLAQAMARKDAKGFQSLLHDVQETNRKWKSP